MINLLPLDIFGMQSDTISHDGILFKPLVDMEILVPNFFVSKCAKIIEIKKNGKIIYLKYQEWYRGKKEHGEFKGMRVEFSTDIQPYLDNGHKYKAKDKLGWEPKLSLKDLVADMMKSDLDLFYKKSLINS